ncbi:MAG: type II toxin-antitoxin system RelB/DinJ family antitoxin [Lactobacillales bacterium]|jgi:DNA-damage-inducible protein J|nr:type II toxin-antitoxin system RelB/DinJ family antitoxin [Lactobacillales bacterium]
MESIIKDDDINVRTNKELHKKVLSILNDLSLDMTTAINIYLNQIVIHQGLPFEISLQSKQNSQFDDYDKGVAYAQFLEEMNKVNDTDTQWFSFILLQFGSPQTSQKN